MTKTDEKLADSKLLILYILQKVNKPIDYKELLELVISISDINYFDFQQFLLDLLENGYIINYVKDDHSFYDITKFGKETLELTQNILPGIIKLRVDSNFKNELETFEEEHSIIAEYTPRSEDYFTVSCKIIEHNDTIFEVKTFAGSREQAKEIVENWKNHANEIYPEILNILTKKQKESNS